MRLFFGATPQDCCAKTHICSGWGTWPCSVKTKNHNLGSEKLIIIYREADAGKRALCLYVVQRSMWLSLMKAQSAANEQTSPARDI